MNTQLRIVGLVGRSRYLACHFHLRISTVSTVTDLSTLDSLRDEHRSLRAQLARLRTRLHLQLALQFAADAAVVLTVTAVLLVLLHWWFRFSLPVRLVLIALSVAGVLVLLGVLRGSAVAVGLDRRAFARGVPRSLPARGRTTGRRRASAPRPAG